jgi:hypothetical protein
VGDYMPEIIQLGPFMIQSIWLLLIVSGYTGYVIMQYSLKKTENNVYIPILDKSINALLLVFLCWKLSPLLFTPSILWTNPLSLLILPGSIYGIWIGIVIALLYLFRELRLLKMPCLFYTDLLSVGLVSIIFIYQLLGWRYGSLTAVAWGISILNPLFRYHPINIYVLLVTLPMLVWIYKNMASLGRGKIFINVMSYYMIGLMLVSFFEVKINLMFGLSIYQMTYLCLMLFSFILSAFLNRYKEHEKFEEEGNGIQYDDAGLLPSDSRNAVIDEIRPENSSQEKRTILSDKAGCINIHRD